MMSLQLNCQKNLQIFKTEEKMKYLEKLKRDGKLDLYAYTKACFNGEIPDFLEKYLTLPMFQTLEGKGQFCGVENTKLFHPRCKYNRLDHSMNCAGIIWRLTQDKKRTLCALCHDLSTVSFAHTIDFLLKDTMNQNSAESLIDMKKILQESVKFQEYLEEDGIALEELEDIVNPESDSLVDIERPGLCVDRLEGIISTNYIWLNICSLDEVRRAVNNLTICKNNQGKEEIGFKDLDQGKLFFNRILFYAYALQSKEDKYSMQFIADLLEIAMKDGLLKIEDLYTLEEEQIVVLLKDNYEIWKEFTSLDKIESSNLCPNGYYVETGVKKRYAIPLVKIGNESVRITDIDTECNDKLQEFLKFREKKYLFNDKIKMLERRVKC